MKYDVFQDFLHYKSIIFALAVTDLKLRYRSSVLGALWSFLEPLLILTILFVVFSSILKNNIPNYPIFLLLGIILYQFFSRSTTMGLESILQRQGVVSSIKISKSVFPISATFTALFMMGFEFIILFVFMGIFQFVPTMTMLFLPILIIMLFFLSLGLTMSFSVLNVHYRDMRSIWAIVLQAIFFLTPIFYKLDFLPKSLRDVAQFSPLAQILTMSHEAVLENKLPDLFWFLYVLGSTCCIFLIGLLIFQRYKTNILEKF